ncbi:MAG: hypothetical protein RR068_14350 [Hafnia sp.]
MLNQQGWSLIANGICDIISTVKDMVGSDNKALVDHNAQRSKNADELWRLAENAETFEEKKFFSEKAILETDKISAETEKHGAKKHVYLNFLIEGGTVLGLAAPMVLEVLDTSRRDDIKALPKTKA